MQPVKKTGQRWALLTSLAVSKFGRVADTDLPLAMLFLICSDRTVFTKKGGHMMGTPLAWHKRHALTIAGQLPENMADALLILQAVQELVVNFMAAEEDVPLTRSANVLPFGNAG